jgi:hypothetical protein
MAGLITAALAIVGVFWFGLLSLAAWSAYSPAGVRPREIGLSSAAILSQAAIGPALVVAVSLIWAVFLGSNGRGTRSLIKWIIAALAVATFLTLLEAYLAQRALDKGRTSRGLFLDDPIRRSSWSGEIAELTWAQERPAGAPALPRCALYLGEAGGTAVFYSAPDNRTWRLPSSSVIVTTRPDRNSC